MTSFSTVIWVALAVVILGGVGVWATRTLVLQGKLLPDLRLVFAAIAAPADYFLPLAASGLALSQEGSRIATTLRHRYAGEHVVELSVSKPSPVGVMSYRGKFRVSVECLVSGKTRLSKQLDAVGDPWWSRAGGGVTLMAYSVPDELPLGDEIELVATVEVADAEFERQYGPATLIVRKASEK